MDPSPIEESGDGGLTEGRRCGEVGGRLAGEGRAWVECGGTKGRYVTLQLNICDRVNEQSNATEIMCNFQLAIRHIAIKSKLVVPPCSPIH